MTDQEMLKACTEFLDAATTYIEERDDTGDSWSPQGKVNYAADWVEDAIRALSSNS